MGGAHQRKFSGFSSFNGNFTMNFPFKIIILLLLQNFQEEEACAGVCNKNFYCMFFWGMPDCKLAGPGTMCAHQFGKKNHAAQGALSSRVGSTLRLLNFATAAKET